MGNKKKSKKMMENGEDDMNMTKSEVLNNKANTKRTEMSETTKFSESIPIKKTKNKNTALDNANKKTNNVFSEELRKKQKKRKSSEALVKEKQNIYPPKIRKTKTNTFQIVEAKNASTKLEKNKIKLIKGEELEVDSKNNDELHNNDLTGNVEFVNNKSTDDAKCVNRKSKTKIKKTNLEMDAEYKNKDITNTADTSNKGREKAKINKKTFLNEDEAEVKDEDIDKFCDEITEEDNKTYENWVKLFEENFKKTKD